MLGFFILILLSFESLFVEDSKQERPQGVYLIILYAVAPKKIKIFTEAEDALVASVGAPEVFAMALTHPLARKYSTIGIPSSAADGC